jgi:hypothetical protein
MKTITVNEKQFTEAAYPLEIEPSIFAKKRNIEGFMRESIRLTVSASYAEVAEAFVNGAAWSIAETVIDENGKEVAVVYDKSEYSVAGDIVDHRDGRITVYMAKPTENEIIRANIDSILPIIDDEIAVTVPNLFPSFAVGKAYKTGDRINHNGKLYKVVQDHVSAAEWTPETSASLYSPVTVGGTGYDEWKQPTGAHDAYNKGDRAEFGGKVYESKIDGNVHSPEANPDAWTLVEA